MGVQAGTWNFDGKPVDRQSLIRISHELTQYGPGSETTSFDGQIGFLYRAYHTTSDSRIERQPHFSGNGQVVTWDGRLDNRDELISQLSSTLRDEHTDVAIIAAAFDRWGPDCLNKLVGDWALTIWDLAEKKLILARDYIGARQLFYRCTLTQICWCSHLAPLALCGDTFHLCDEYLAGYFGYWPDAQLTPYREISSVPPGCFVSVHNALATSHRYWSFRAHSPSCGSDAEYEDHFRHLFRQAVRRRLRTDSPVLAELSGGLDSSSIVCMADDILTNEGAEAPYVDTFSFYDLGEPDEEDFLFFPRVEEKRGRVGHHAELNGRGDSFSLQHERFAATPGFNSRQELRTALGNVIRTGNYRVILSGLGGDQFLGQVPDPEVFLADLIVQLRPITLSRELVSWSLTTRQPWVRLFAKTVITLLPSGLRVRLQPVARAEPWLDSQFAQRHRIRERLVSGGTCSWSWLPSVRRSFQMLSELSGQLTALAPVIEEKRYPFLDRTLVEFLLSLPSEQLARAGQDRSLMRRSLVGLLPDDIRLRRSKSGTGRCAAVTLQKHWAEVETLLCSPLVARLGYVDDVSFRDALLGMKTGREPDFVVQLLRALSLELWLGDAIARGVIADPKLEGPTSLSAPTSPQVYFDHLQKMFSPCKREFRSAKSDRERR
ncbi:MAG TPA: asparagine synthase-related protein [Terriglobales bacterium]|nr:asparagine synthase-related protein [Terriglobales bacterium]